MDVVGWLPIDVFFQVSPECVFFLEVEVTQGCMSVFPCSRDIIGIRSRIGMCCQPRIYIVSVWQLCNSKMGDCPVLYVVLMNKTLKTMNFPQQLDRSFNASLLTDIYYYITYICASLQTLWNASFTPLKAIHWPSLLCVSYIDIKTLPYFSMLCFLFWY